MGIKKSQYAFQSIPTRFKFIGDIEKCKSLIGFARQQFARYLEIDEANKYNKHLKKNRRWPTLKSTFGELVSIKMICGVSFIDIYVPLPEGQRKIEKEILECPCFKCMTFGIILSVSAGTFFGRFIYDIALCTGQDEITVYQDFSSITSTGYSKYVEGQYVFVANRCDLNCDEAKPNCVMDNESEELNLLIVPIHNEAQMKPETRRILSGIYYDIN